MSKIFNSIKNINDKKFNDISTLVLGLYFLLALIPFFTNRIPIINSFFASSGIVATLLRALGLLLLLIYSSMCIVKYKIKVNLKVAIALLFLLLVITTNSLFVKKQYVSTYIDNRMVMEVVFKTGIKQMIVSLFVTYSDLIFMFCVFFILPYCLNVKTIIKYILIPFILFMSIECLYAIIAQGRYLLSSSDSFQVTGTFPSKNDFGAFLTSSFLCCIFIFVYSNSFLTTSLSRRIQATLSTVLIILMIVFLLFSLAIGCKTAFFSMVLVFVIFCFTLIKFLYFKNHKKAMSILIVLMLSLSTILVLFFAIPSLHSNGPFLKLYLLITNKLKDSSNESFLSRLNIWVLAMDNLDATAHIFGITKGNIMAFTKVSTGLLSSLHNAFLTIYVSYGAIGFAVYGFCSFFVLRSSFYDGGNSRFNFLLFISLCVASFIFMWSESEMLPFFSCSAIVFIINLLFAILISFKNKDLTRFLEVAI